MRLSKQAVPCSFARASFFELLRSTAWCRRLLFPFATAYQTVLTSLCLQVLVYYEYAFAESDEQQLALDKLRLECLLNLASCKLRTRQYDEVIDVCTQACHTLVCCLVPCVDSVVLSGVEL